MAAVIENKPFTIDEWRVEPSLNRLSRADEVVKIDPQNMKVLELLASRPGEVISQAEIEQKAWAGVIVTPNSVYQSIAQLRRALGDDRANPRYIETIARKGYRLIATRSEFDLKNTLPKSSSSNSAVRAAMNRYFDRLARHHLKFGLALVTTMALLAGAKFYPARDAPLNIAENSTDHAVSSDWSEKTAG